MLFTGKGDNGTTKTFGCDQRISKSSAVAEALGSLDEINSLLGLVKVKAYDSKLDFENVSVGNIIHSVQEELFIIQSSVAGFDKELSPERTKRLEEIINKIEKLLPPIKTFFISGGSELAAIFDYSRTVARRAERRVVAVSEEGKVKVTQSTLSYLNRLSSLLYAMARYSNFRTGSAEIPPSYK